MTKLQTEMRELVGRLRLDELQNLMALASTRRDEILADQVRAGRFPEPTPEELGMARGDRKMDAVKSYRARLPHVGIFEAVAVFKTLVPALG